jgi:hypothetical protein
VKKENAEVLIAILVNEKIRSYKTSNFNSWLKDESIN